MKLKTSITLSEDTVRELDELAGPSAHRSRVIEEALRDYLERRRRERRDARELAILDRNAEGLNREVEDVLAYQREP